MSKKDDMIMDMMDELTTIITIECNNCATKDTVHNTGDDYTAAELFYKDGWRLKAGKVYCKKCSKKKK